MKTNIGRVVAKNSLRTIFGCRGSFLDVYTNNLIDVSRVSIEHVVPKSKLPRGMMWDLNNLLLIDRDVNSRRGNSRFAQDTIHGVCFEPMYNKGHVARICAHVLDNLDKEDCRVDVNDVIDNETMLTWNAMFPASDLEKYATEYIFSVQGTYNTYVDDSSMMALKWNL